MKEDINNPLLKDIEGQHGLTKDILSKIPHIHRVQGLLVSGERLLVGNCGLSHEDANSIIEKLRENYTAPLLCRKDGGRDGSGMMF